MTSTTRTNFIKVHYSGRDCKLLYGKAISHVILMINLIKTQVFVNAVVFVNDHTGYLVKYFVHMKILDY